MTPVPPARHAWRVRGGLDDRALRRVVARIGGDDGGPGRVQVTMVDLRHVPDLQAELGPMAREQAAAMETDAGLLLDLCVAAVDDGRTHVLIPTTRCALHPTTVRTLVADLLDLHAAETGAPRAASGSSLRRTEVLVSELVGGPSGSPGSLEPVPRRWSAEAVLPDAALHTWCFAHQLDPAALLLAGVAVLLEAHELPGRDTVEVQCASRLRPLRAELPPLAGRTPDEAVVEVTHALERADEPSDGSTAVAVSHSGHLTPVLVGGLSAEPMAVDAPRPDSALTVDTEQTPVGLRVRVECADGVVRATAAEILERLLSVWKQFPHATRIDAIEALSESDWYTVRAAAAGPALDLPDRCMHDIVLDHAVTMPDVVAVACGDQTLTYGALERAASRAGGYLRVLGIGPGDVVAVLTDRSVDAVLAVFAVLAAGAAYVPVDPDYPPERVARVVGDSRARLLLGTAATLARHSGSGVPTVDLWSGKITTAPEQRPETGCMPDDLVYVIYTSGSTGAPKGVEVSHRALMRSNAARVVGGEPPGTDLLTMPLVFDGSASGMWWTLTSGGTLVLPTDDEIRDPRRVAALAARYRITHVHSIPSYYAALDDAAGEDGLPDLRMVSVGGEPLPPRLVAQHLRHHPGALLLNDYGPTEATVWASAHPCTLQDAVANAVPIGRPLPNYRLRVLDDRLRAVPPGVVGELYIGGGLARGYLGRAGLTAERFLPDPDGPGRLYRTGDRARLRADGRFEVLGRVDDQVKIRGFRVELGELEATLCSHPGVEEAAVVVGSEPPRTGYLVAFAVVRGGGVSAPGLHYWLAERLPTYMVPERVDVLDALPRNHNGKVDVSALRLSAARRGGQAQGPIPTGGPVTAS